MVNSIVNIVEQLKNWGEIGTTSCSYKAVELSLEEYV